MRRKDIQTCRKINNNKCFAFLLAVCLLLHAPLPVSAGANEVVKDSGAEECVEIQLPVEKQQQFVSEDEVISVSMPLQTPFTMNPTKSFGEEQIWSPVFHFQNNSQTAVEVTVRNIRYTLKENSTVVTHYQPFNDLDKRKKKEIYLCLRFGETEVPVGDLSREYRFTLSESGTGSLSGQEFSIEGMMSCYPEEEWQDGDVAIAFQVEYKAVLGKQAESDRKEASDNMQTDDGAENERKASDEQTAGDTEMLAEVKGTEWQKNVIGAILTDKGTGDAGTADICAYITDSGKTDRAAGQTAKNSGNISGENDQKTVQNTDMTVEKSGEKEEFSFDWQKILDDYGKYADAIPEGGSLLLDINEAAESPAGYVMEEGLEGFALDMQNTGDVYAFWRNPDYVPEENKVWHIEDDVPYYISNPQQPWLWAAGEDAPQDTEPLFMWIRKDYTAQYRTDDSYAPHPDTGKKEGNAEYGPGNDTSGTSAE